MGRDCKNWDWILIDADGTVASWEQAQMAVLQDIRAELRTLNELLSCDRFLSIPSILAKLDRRVANHFRLKKSKH